MTLQRPVPAKSNMAAPAKKQALENGEDTSVPSASPAPGPTSTRKQLPSIPDSATQQTLANKMADKKATSPRGNHSYGQFYFEYSMQAEFNQLQQHKLPGVYVLPSAKSALLWNGVLFVRQGYYQGGVFRFTVHLPENYPDGDCPRLMFDPPVFHPVIDPLSGELDVKRAFQKWRRNVHHIWQVLMYARRVFCKIDTKNPLNAEAATLYEQDLDSYKSKVAESIKISKEKLYEPPSTDDPHAIRFSPWDPEIHEEARKKMLTPKVPVPKEATGKNAQTSGLSWMSHGCNQLFSRDDSASA